MERPADLVPTRPETVALGGEGVLVPDFVFEHRYVGGGDFRQAVLAGRLPLDERIRVVLEVGEALEFAHGRGIVHRDVKPANVLLGLDGRPKLTDFDLVRAVDTTGGTRTSSMLGTILYAAPEAMLDAREAGIPVPALPRSALLRSKVQSPTLNARGRTDTRLETRSTSSHLA